MELLVQLSTDRTKCKIYQSIFKNLSTSDPDTLKINFSEKAVSANFGALKKWESVKFWTKSSDLIF